VEPNPAPARIVVPLALMTIYVLTDRTSQDMTSVPDLEGSSPRQQAQLSSHLELVAWSGWMLAVISLTVPPFQQGPRS